MTKEKIGNINIGNVESMINNNVIDKVIHNNYKGAPRNVVQNTPPEGSINEEQKHFIYTHIQRLGELRKIISNDSKQFAFTQTDFKNKYKLASYANLHSEQYDDAKKWLHIEIAKCITQESVIKKPPKWWRDYLTTGIYSKIGKYQISDDEWRLWLIDRFGCDSVNDLDEKSLAALFVTTQSIRSGNLPKKEMGSEREQQSN